MRDYERWLDGYEDPTGPLSWRLGVVQAQIHADLDRRPGQVRVLSCCSGDGRDVLGVLASRHDAHRVSTTLLELHPGIAQRARVAAANTPGHVEVRTIDAGNTRAYVGAVPADIVVLIGVLGNISDEDLGRTIAASPQLCTLGATLLWSRGRDRDDRNHEVRSGFAAAGFTEVDFMTMDPGDGTAVGVVRYDGVERSLEPDVAMFTFVR